MIISAVTALVFIYIALRCILPLRVAAPCKLALLLLAALILGKAHIARFLHQSWTPEFPFLLQTGWTLLHSALLTLAVLGMVTDILRLPFRLLRRTVAKAPAAASRQGPHPALPLVSLLIAVFGTLSALRVPPITPVEIVVPGLPAAWDGLTVAHLSDLHASATFSAHWISGMVDTVNAARPDLIVITGDLLDGSPRQRNDDLRPLRRLHAPLGVYACPGNHEYYSDLRKWEPIFPSLGVHMLENDHVILRRNGAELALAGLADSVAERFRMPLPDIRQALGSTAENLPLILMAHRPNLVEQLKKLPRSGATLQLSGHTHGGQVLGLDLVVRRLNDGYLRGLYKLGDIRLYVSPGAALWSGFPFRLGVPSEIPLLTLHSPHAGPDI